MTIKKYAAQVANAILSPLGVKLVKTERGALDVATGPVNNGAFWDAYVHQWEKSEENILLERVGNEWKNEEIFLALLKKNASLDSTALEIGCGGGRITSSAIRWFKHVHACDVSKEMIRTNQERIRGTNVTYHELDGFTLSEFADGSLDCVFSHDVFVHFSSLQVYPYFAEIRRVLKRDGVGIVSFYNFPRHFELFKDMSLQFNQQKTYPPHMRVHFITEQMISLMLEDVGLKVQEMDRTNFLIPVFRK
ncbi:MAG: class I SAM-dependent methyltransferase [Nitrospira sp.]|nr:class I SAM-dependent methyltransferase [Nitrospira sp.]